MTIALPLSVLDLATVTTGSSTADALRRDLQLAQAADELGYERFWVAEHHNMPAVASTSPAVLIAALGAQTLRIRVGSGGVMLPNHAPYVVAEQFALLEAMYPGRIDLGLGRAPGTDQRTARALRRSADTLSAEEFPRQVLQVLSWLGDDRLDDSPAAALAATPHAETYPEVWLLGSSGYSAQLAGMLGLRYCYAHHFGQLDPVAVMDAYRARFTPSPVLAEPHAMVCTSIITAPSDAEADHLAGPARIGMLQLRQGRPEPVLSPDDAAARPTSPLDDELLASAAPTKFVGAPEHVRPKLQALIDRTGVQELMVTATTYAVETRIQTLRDVAAMGLTTP